MNGVWGKPQIDDSKNMFQFVDDDSKPFRSKNFGEGGVRYETLP